MSLLANLSDFVQKPEQRETMLRTLRHRTRGPASGVLYRSVGLLVNRLLLPFFIEHRPDFHYHFENFPEYQELFESWVAGNLANNCGDVTRFYMLYQNVTQVLDEGVPGDLVELGVYKGNSARLLAVLGRRRGRRLYLFDTFSGFDTRDFRGLDAQRQADFGDTSLEGVQRLVGVENVTYVPGFFPESTRAVAMPAQIAVAHLDCDLYEPMKAGLERFYPLLSPGGLLVMHDYSSGFWPGATRAVDEFFAQRPEKPILVPDKSGTAIIRKV